MFTRLKQKVKEESSFDSTSPILSATNNNNLEKTTGKSISSSEAGINSSDEGCAGSIKEIALENINSDLNSINKTTIEKLNSLERETQIRKNVSRTNSVTNDLQENQSNDKKDLNFSSSFIQNQESNIKFELKKLNESLFNQVEELTKELNEKLGENESLRSQLNKLNSQFEDNQYEMEKFKLEIEDYKSMILNFEKDIRDLNKDKDELIIKNAELSEKYELLKLVNTKQQHTSSTSKSETHREDEAHAVNKTLSSSTSQEKNLTDECKLLRDELNEKNKVIKNLQHRINDMKKTLQKELKYQALPNEQLKSKNMDNNHLHEESNQINNLSNNYPSLPSTPITTGPNNFSSLSNNHKQELLSSSQKISPTLNNNLNRKFSVSAEIKNNQNRKYSINSSGGGFTDPAAIHSIQHLVDDVNFKYLKHVVLKFLTCKEYEALHLVKALSVLLNFSNDEEKILKETLQYKMSWFGTRPKLL